MRRCLSHNAAFAAPCWVFGIARTGLKGHNAFRMRKKYIWKSGWLPLLALMLVLGAGAQSTRTVHGTVLDNDGETIKGAVVQMKDVPSRMIRSFITQDDGAFQFMGLNPDIDYELRAHWGGRWSGKKMVSRFDSREAVQVVLTIDAGTT